MNKEERLALLREEIGDCRLCPLCEERNKIVFGRGNAQAAIMMIGEGPGADEDKQGQPFVGRAGQLLDRILAAASLPEEEIFIANVVKCRPPKNRLPQPEEIEICKDFLRKQIDIIRPQIIICLGAVSTQLVVDPKAKITKVRGNWFQKGKFSIMPTFHPAALLRDGSKKKDVWADMQMVRNRYLELQGLEPLPILPYEKQGDAQG